MNFVKSILTLLFVTIFIAAATTAFAGDESVYFAPDKVKLTTQEKATINMAKNWESAQQSPIQTSNGKVAFVYGSSIPRIVASPLNITDIELEANEVVQGVLLGDSARWIVESAIVGTTPHIFVKPLDVGLETSAVITTTTRAYHLKFVSKRNSYMPYIGFVYPRTNMYGLKNEQAIKQAAVAGATDPKNQVNLQNIDFSYIIKGNAKWRPIRVYSFEDKTYIQLPPTPELPILLAKNSSQEIIVNYRVDNNTYMIDGTYKELVLVLGVGSKAEKVSIKKDK
ncbi:P-type conjugative transfer protein TrbG [Desulfovibrio sp. OttesenSCG-928-F07]|nr:P-type conjugative transfer protein TrbG [Desulfovibrio sp. OttesenSCG-928-F07]